jgi:two-component system, CAI-1 autoinducer sensor kinase/phosphatase CqsS
MSVAPRTKHPPEHDANGHARSGNGLMRFLRVRLWNLRSAWSRLETRMFTRTRYSQPKMVAIGVVGAGSMVVYYPIWAYLFPQPFEDLTLRVVVGLMFLPLALIHWWPRRLRPLLPTYWYTVMTLAMPFFVGYMTLRNATPAWLMTHLAVTMLLMMLFDVVSFLLVYSVGTVMAVTVFLAAGHTPFPAHEMIEYLPLMVFALVGGAVCSVSQNMAEQSQVDALTAASNNIAHELRTPLGSLRISAQAVRRYLPDLLRSHHLAEAARLPVTELRGTHLVALERSLDVMDREVSYANTVIDMLLLAARPIGEVPLSRLSARHCVEQAVARYPYASRAERERVGIEAGSDFSIIGSETLVVHIIFNLLRNALYHTERVGKGVIRIRLEETADTRLIRVRDTGPGIPRDVLPRIFNRFYSHADDGRGVTGLGIGLAFARAAMEHMNGQIECDSVWGEFTEFTLGFPLPEEDAAP